MFTFVFTFAAAAQETTDESVGAEGTDTQQPLVFAEGEQAAQAQAAAEQPGPLAGTEVETLSTGPDAQVETIIIPRADCTFEQGASFVLQDDDGTQADFIDNVNVRIKLREFDGGLKVVSNRDGRDADIVPLNERGGDKVLDSGGLVIVTSTGIGCEASASPPSDPPPSASHRAPHHRVLHHRVLHHRVLHRLVVRHRALHRRVVHHRVLHRRVVLHRVPCHRTTHRRCPSRRT